MAAFLTGQERFIISEEQGFAVSEASNKVLRHYPGLARRLETTELAMDWANLGATLLVVYRPMFQRRPRPSRPPTEHQEAVQPPVPNGYAVAEPSQF
jgi:hypothetical protein